MTEIFGIPIQAFLGQLMLGLVNGAFYAMLSLGLAVIFGLLDIVNFAHGALYMVGAFFAWIMLDKWGINYWAALFLAPLLVGILVDSVSEVLRIEAADLEPLPALGHGMDLDFVQGLAKTQGKVSILLDIDKVVQSQDLGSLQEVLEQKEALAGATA